MPADDRQQYDDWFERNAHALQTSDWKTAFQPPDPYPYASAEHRPWTPLATDLAQTEVALLTSGGVYIADEQERFDAAAIEGDYTWRRIPADTPADRLAIAHEHYDSSAAERDINCVMPAQRLTELADEGVIGALHPSVFSFHGYATKQWQVRDDLAPALADAVVHAGVDAALLVPV